MQAFASLARQRNVAISEHLVNEVVHRRLLELAPLPRLATERRWAPDRLFEEVADINAACLPTDEASRYTSALDALALVHRGVRVVAHADGRLAFVQTAVEGFDLCRPELESACVVCLVATKCDLGWAVREHVQYLAIYTKSVGNTGKHRVTLTRYIAHLVVVEDGLAAGVASHVDLCRLPVFLEFRE